ncbi:MAG: hypothetical protein VB087_03460 [Candidatus Limiplasma sp.]|nr:hypothetical protein [Candidatus Limiplasma sp.]
MKHPAWKRRRSLLAIVLCILMLLQGIGMPVLAEVLPTATGEPETVLPTTPAPEDTPTATRAATATLAASAPAPEVTILTAETATAEVTATPEESATPEASPTPDTTATPDASSTPEATATPEDSAAPEASATPEDSATPEASAAPSDVPTPTASVTPASTQTPMPTAPVCHTLGCRHVALDGSGKLTALCEYGAWLIANQPEDAMTLASAPLTMALVRSGAYGLIDGTTTIYRSGTYTLSGGTALSNLVISDNLAVALILDGVRIGRLTVGSDATVQVDFRSRNRVDAMRAGSGELQLNGTGSLSILVVDDLATARFTMGSGSISLPAGAVSLNGHIPYLCSASGATSATLDGTSLPFTTPDEAGQASLWLPPLGRGGQYESQVIGTVLTVRSVAAAPSVTATFDMDGIDDYTAVAGQGVSVISSTGSPIAHSLDVNQSNVTLALNNGQFRSTMILTLHQDARLHLAGSNGISRIEGAKATITGSGTLTVDDLNVSELQCAADVRISYTNSAGTWAGYWQALTSPIDVGTVTSLTYGGRSYAIAQRIGVSYDFLAPLPTPASGMRYDVRAVGTTLEVAQMPTGTQTLVLGGGNLNITANGNYVILTDGTASGAIRVADGVQATLLLRAVRTGGGLSLGTGANVTLSLEGSSSLGGAIALGTGTTFSVGGTGALYASQVSSAGSANVSISGYTNLTLASGSTLGGSNLVPTLIHVADAGGTPVRNAGISLKIGSSAPFRTTTATNGQVTLWRSRAITNAAAVVLNSANTYADIISGGTANPEGLPTISGLTIHREGYVTFTASGAQTMGIQVYVNRGGAAMPDTFDASALQVQRLGGECNIPGLKTGDEVIFRAYAARLAGQTLSAATADAFTFSDQKSFTVTTPRQQFTLAEQSKEYDRKAFAFRSGLIPSGATVTYYRGTTQLSGAPTDVGQYTAAVSIPAGHAKYLPGVSMVSVVVERKMIYIYPEASGKVMGQEDPPFFYTYDPLYGSDEVTGVLGRVLGEEPGNYPFTTDWLIAPDYYRLVVHPDSPMFFIDWDPGHFAPYDPLKVIDPVHQVIRFSDGKKLDLILRTGDKLNISGVGYGEMVMDPRDRKSRPFTPELRLRRGVDQAMVILQAEPELRSDGGYETDDDGNTLLSPRALTLSGYQLSRFQQQRITTVGFRLGDVMCVLDLADLTSEKVLKAAADAGMSRLGTRYQISMTPVNSVRELADRSVDAQDAKALGAQMMDVTIQIQSGMMTLDIADILPSARTLFNVSSLLAAQAETTPGVREVTVGKKTEADAQAEPITTDVMDMVQRLTLEQLSAQGVALQYFGTKVQTLDSRLVVPYTASEAEVLPYTAVMRTNPFLMVRHDRNGLYGLTKTLPQ